MSDRTAASTAIEADSPILWLLKRRHEDLSSMFRTAWDLYIKFYTVFLTFSVAVMGWMLTRESLPNGVIRVIAVVLIAQSFLTAITSAAIAIYSRHVSRDQIRLEHEVIGQERSCVALLNIKGIPVALAIWSGWANSAAMIAMSFAWFYVGFIMRGH